MYINSLLPALGELSIMSSASMLPLLASRGLAFRPKIFAKESETKQTIKRAPTAFNLYVSEAIKRLIVSQPNLKPKDRLAAAAKEFKGLSETAKKPYVDQANKLKEVTQKERAKKEAERKANQILAPYSSYVKDNYSKVKAENPSTKNVDILKLVAQKWKAEPAEKKDAMKKAYEQAVAAKKK